MDIMDYTEKINKHSLMLDSMAETYAALMDRLSFLERVAKSSCITYLTNNPDSKSSMEKIEMLAVKDDPKIGREYIELIGIRIVVKSLERRMELIEKQMQATQSQMKWNDDRTVRRIP